jgi:hypothetical protein
MMAVLPRQDVFMGATVVEWWKISGSSSNGFAQKAPTL